MVLFGNLEASDLENLPAEEFRLRVQRALSEGTIGTGRCFVLMASAGEGYSQKYCGKAFFKRSTWQLSQMIIRQTANVL